MYFYNNNIAIQIEVLQDFDKISKEKLEKKKFICLVRIKKVHKKYIEILKEIYFFKGKTFYNLMDFKKYAYETFKQP